MYPRDNRNGRASLGDAEPLPCPVCSGPLHLLRVPGSPQGRWMCGACGYGLLPPARALPAPGHADGPILDAVSLRASVSFRVSEALQVELKVLAARRRTTVQAMVTGAIEEWLDRQPEGRLR